MVHSHSSLHYGVSFALAVLFLAVQLVLALQAVARERCLFSKACLAVSKLRNACCYLSVSSSAPHSEIDDAVRQKLQASQVGVFSKSCILMTAVSTVGLVDLIRNTLMSRQRLLTLHQDVLIFLLYGVLLLRQGRPGLVRSSNVNAWYSCMMVLLSLFVAPGICTSDSLPFIEKLVVPWVGLLSIARLDVCWTAAWHAVFTGALVANYLMADMDARTKYYNCHYLLTQNGITLLCTGWLQNSLQFLIRNEMQAGMLQGKQSAGNALLRIFYDVVMELDGDLEITSSRGMDGFLQRGSGSRQHFTGTRLQDLMPRQEDQERFFEHMHRAPDLQDGLANVMHLEMSGGEGLERLEVELFSFQFKGPAGRSRHLIGLREFSDDRVARDMSAPSAEEPSCAAQGGTAAEVQGGGAEASAGAALWLRVEIMADSLPVLGLSPACQRLLGVVGGGASLNTLVESPGDLMKWVERVVNQHVEGAPDDSHCSETFAVAFRPRNQAGRVRIHANCQVDLSSLRPIQDDDSEPAMPVTLVLQDVRTARLLRKRRGEDGSGSSGLGTPGRADGRHKGTLPAKVQSL